jgi:hypothetical protein
VQVATGGPPGGAHPGDGLANLHLVTRADGNRLKVVVGGDEAVAVVDFHPVTAAPGMPAGSPHNAGIGGVNGGAARSRVVLAKMEITCRPRQRAGAEAEGRARIQEGQRCHQETGGRPADTRQFN